MPETVTIEVTHYSLPELKDVNEDGFTEALEQLTRFETMSDWWYTTTLEGMVETMQEKYGITFDPKEVSFDLDRGSFVTFGKKGTFVDERVFLRVAGIDLRTKLGRELLQSGLVIGENSGYRASRNWIGYASWEGLPDYVLDLQPNVGDWLANTLENATGEILTALRDEYEYIQSEEYLLEMAEANEYRFLEDGTIWHG